MKEFQTTPLGLWNRAKEFAKAASIVADAAGAHVFLPAYYLWGHSIELCLKAFLFACGVPLRKLKIKELGHNLKALVDEAGRHNIKRKVHLNVRELGEIYVLITSTWQSASSTTRQRLIIFHLRIGRREMRKSLFLF